MHTGLARKTHALSIFACLLLSWFLQIDVAHADEHGFLKVQPQKGTVLGRQAVHISGGRTFVWQFSCGAGDCVIGQFIGGDIWVAPKEPGEKVILNSVVPMGEEHGLEVNPMEQKKQGLLSCQAATYERELNLMTSLPAKLQVGSSLVKATQRTVGCGTKSIKGCCIESYDVLTILQHAPKDGGVSAFRPGFAGGGKRIFYLDDFDFAHMPKDARVPLQSREQYESAHHRWHAPYVDHFMGAIGNPGRAFAPHAVLPDYGAEQAGLYLNDLLGAMAYGPLENRMPAITGLLQRGIDLYASWKAGVTWPSGAGQQMGRKPPIVFFASLVKDQNIKREVMTMATDNGNDTQEDGQIRVIPNAGNVPIWGDVGKGCEEDRYWTMLFNAHFYAGSPSSGNSAGDNKRTCGDPYGWIDGPAGKPGTFYMGCCSTGGHIAYSIAQNLMPELCRVANDPHLNEYVRRILRDGLHTLPDQCAPPDPREDANCKPYKAGAPGCLYYRVTWGPDPRRANHCITNGAGQNGRFPDLHGAALEPIYNEPGLSRALRERFGHRLFASCTVN